MHNIVYIGAVPYPGISNEDVFNMIKLGYQMSKPDGCSEER